MVGQTVTETWFSTIWKSSRKSISWEPEKPTLGILAFEVSRFMSKVANLWHCLSDRQIIRLREEIANSIGIHKLISEDEDYLMDLALAEIIDNLCHLAKSVAIIGKKCSDPTYQNLENIFDDPKWYGWQYRFKKMEKKVKKMERFVAATEQLYQEIEVLAELEQSLKRMRAGADLGQVKLLEFQQKVIWQRQEVKNLREMSPWVRTYDYIVRLLLRSLFTILERIKYVDGINPNGNLDDDDDDDESNGDLGLIRSNSISALMQASVYPSENRFLIPLGRSFSNLGLGGDKIKSNKMKFHDRFLVKKRQAKARRLAPIGFATCMNGAIETPVVESYSVRSNGQNCADEVNLLNRVSFFFESKVRLLNAPSSTLGYAALALHYANLIKLIEKFAGCPHLISLDARDDLYNMLPGSIKSSLRGALMSFSRNSDLSGYNDALAAEWRSALGSILEWISPLAHNTVRWHSERNFEKHRSICGSNVLLVQTLYFANRMEVEGAIIELLVGLNYVSKVGR